MDDIDGVMVGLIEYKETDMRAFVNKEVERRLRQKDSAQQVQAIMKAMWRGESLLLACLADGNPITIKLEGMQCLSAFASQENAERFAQMLFRKDGPVVIYQETSIEDMIKRALGAKSALAVESGSENGLILSRQILEGVMRLTTECTGGVLPEEDFPFMQLHLGTVGNYERVKRASNCGCYRCMTIFPSAEATGFMTEQDGSRSAVCPYCRTDTVLAEEDAPITARLLRKMNRRFFGSVAEEDAGVRLLYMECMKERAAKERQKEG